MRYAIAGLALACGVAVTVFVYARLATSPPAEPQNWREQEVRFLSAALGRVQADLDHQHAGEGVASLRRERDTLQQAIAALDKSAIPAGLRDIAPSAPAPSARQEPIVALPSAPAAPLPPVSATPTPPVELRFGSNPIGRPAPDLAGLDLSADVRAPLRPKKISRKPRKEKAEPEKSAAPAADPSERKRAEAPPVR